eukprot:15153101-Heterocapsa_arctica.AAC.1
MKEIGVWNKALKEGREKNDKVNAELKVKEKCADETRSRSRTGHENIGMKIYAGCELIKDNIGLEEYFG